jgi:CRISPR-associated endonuclease Csn1
LNETGRGIGVGIRFAFDLGTNSLGWAVFRGDKTDKVGGAGRFEPVDIAALGTRIFSDGRNPKDGQSLAVMRRVPRGMRKRRDRFLQRQRKLTMLLVAHSLMPQDVAARRALEALEPLALRAAALDDQLEIHHVGRALFHLNQRRGFKSNRKTDGEDAQSGAMAQGAQKLAEAQAESGSKTLGQFLHKRRLDGQRTRFRVAVESRPGKTVYDLYPTRKLVEDEFDAIWQAQAPHHSQTMTETARVAIRSAIFDQRPLKPVKPGRCTLMPDEERLPQALPSVQARIVFETLNALRFGDGLKLNGQLDMAQRKVLALELMGGKDLSFDRIRKVLKLERSVRFSLEEGGREKIEGSKTAKSLSRDKIFGKAWSLLPIAKQEAVVQVLLDEDDTDAAVAWLMAETDLPEENARAASSALLPEGYARLGATANALVVKELASDIVTYDEAVRRAGEASGLFSHHSDFRDGEIMPRLPYYARVIERHVGFGSGDPDEKDEAKRFGRIANPTVHIGLNQLQRVTNRLIQRFGHPDEIIVELARDLKRSAKQREEDQRRNAQNKKQNDSRREKLKELGLPENGLNMALLRLYDEQMVSGVVKCPYTLRIIGLTALFSEAIEIEHILPFSRSLDDGMANKVLCYREANRKKRNQTPFEAYHNAPEWPDIVANAETLPPYKRWRFREDAMERFENRERDMLSRQLNETKHLARAAKAYLAKICGDENGVWVVTGQLTAMMRRQWGLDGILGDDNRKNRNDHRHHAIDAATIGCISRSMLQLVAREAARNEELGAARVVAGFPEPFTGFRDKVRDLARTMIVSHKPEHGKGGALHEDTAYGIVRNERDKAIGNLVHRKPLDSLTVNEIDRVRDPDLRSSLQQVLHEVSEGGGKPDQKALSAALLAWAKADAELIATRTGQQRDPVRRVRLLKPKANAIAVKDRRTGKPYRAVVPDENWCLDVVSFRDGKGGHIWKAFAATLFDVNQPGWRPLWERDKMGGKLVMRLHKGDMVEIDDKDGVRRVKRVVRTRADGVVYLVTNHEAGDYQKRHDADEEVDSFRWDFPSVAALNERNAIKIRFDETGNQAET